MSKGREGEAERKERASSKDGTACRRPVAGRSLEDWGSSETEDWWWRVNKLERQAKTRSRGTWILMNGTLMNFQQRTNLIKWHFLKKSLWFLCEQTEGQQKCKDVGSELRHYCFGPGERFMVAWAGVEQRT